MSIRSRIGIEDPETGRVRSIYCHSDGYPSYNGKLLVEHYKTRQQVERLIRLGSLSCLGPKVGKKVDFDGFRRTGNIDQCLAYGRDRGEKDVGADEDVDAEAMVARATEGWEEFAYLYRQGVWFVREIGGGAGPCLVNANDPTGEAEKPWANVEGVLQFGIGDHRAYGFVGGPIGEEVKTVRS